MKVSYKEFLLFVKHNILELMPDHSNYEVRIEKMTRENNLELYGVAVKAPGDGTAPILNLDNYFREYIKGESISEVLKQIAADYMSAEKQTEKLEHLFNFEWEHVKDLIGFQLMNQKLNKMMLSNSVYTPVVDLAKVYQIIIPFDEQCLGSTPVTKEIMASWNVSMEELEHKANENMMKRFPAKLVNMRERILENMIGIPTRNLLAEGMTKISGDVYILTNQDGPQGASAMLYPGTLEQIRNMLGNDFYIVPDSTEEVIVIPKKRDVNAVDLQSILKGTNSFVPEIEFLSDRVYEYNDNTKTIGIANDGLCATRKASDRVR